MGFLDNFRSTKAEGIQNTWKVLDKMEQLSSLEDASFQRPVAIFKHSVSCGISSMTKFQLESGWDIDAESLDFYYLDLLANRAISNKVADQFGIRHQSPQLILLNKGKVVYDTSHHGIQYSKLKSVLEGLK